MRSWRCQNCLRQRPSRSGPPPQFEDYEQYADVVGRLVSAGCIEDYTRIWWDARPHPRFGTVEVRVMDAVRRVEDAIALAAYAQALVRRYVDAAATPEHAVLAHENKWRAARYGLDATVVDGERGGAVPIRGLIGRTLADLAPHARDLGCERELEGIHAILRDGNGADGQRRAYARGGVAAVAGLIADRTG